MATKRSTSKQTPSETKPKARARIDALFAKWNASLSGYLARRPHRSFRRTPRRDYQRSLKIPGYRALTAELLTLYRRNWKLFLGFFVVYLIGSAIFLGVVNQDNYISLVNTLQSSDPNVWIRTFAIFGSALTGGLSATSNTTSPQIVSVLLIATAWLSMVWLLRHLMNGTKVRLRDGFYNGSAPLVPSVLVAFVGLIQCLPLVLVALGYNAAKNVELLDTVGIEAMLFYAVAAALILLSVYWLTSTIIALVIVTLPGMYPMVALRAAGDLVIGRRFRLILRLLWIVAMIVLVWALVLIPLIFLDAWLKLTWLPLVPLAVLALTVFAVMTLCSYVYLLYRKLVDDDAKPA